MTRLTTFAAVCTLIATTACLSEGDIQTTAFSEASSYTDVQVAELQAQVDDLNAIIGDAAAQDSELAVLVRLKALEDRMDTVESSVGDRAEAGDVFTELSTLRDAVATLRDDVGERDDGDTPLAVASRLKDVEDWRTITAEPTFIAHTGELTAHDGRLTVLEGLSTADGGRISALETWRSTTADPALVDLEDRVSDIQSDYATIDYVNGQIDATETYCDDADIVLGDDLRGEIGDLDAEIPDWILADTTWTVDGVGSTSTTFATPAEAVDAAQAVRIAPDAVLTIEIDDGRYTASVPLEIRHPDGAQLEIVGNTTDPSLVVLEFTGSDGIVVQDGYVLGLLDGVTVEGDDSAGQSGVFVAGRAFVRLGTDVVVEDADFGLNLAQNSTVIATDVTVRRNRSTGIAVDGGSHLFAPGVSSRSNGSMGMWLQGGSSALANDGDFALNAFDGVLLWEGSSLTAPASSFTANGRNGLAVEQGSAFRVEDGEYRSNAGYGIAITSGSGGFGSRSVYSSNGVANVLEWNTDATAGP